MKIFLDTNVILEHFIEREDAKTATLLFINLQEQKHDLYMSAGSVYEMENSEIIGIKEAGKMIHAAIRGGHATLDLETMRENLHQMVREVYSKP